MNRKFVDLFFKYLFSVVALFSVLALGAILLFVFVQGSMPFFIPTAKNIRLVAQRIDELAVNGTPYQNHSTFIDLPKDASLISIRFPSDGGEELLDIRVNTAEKDPEKKLVFVRNERGEVTYPESYVYTVSWPGTIAALNRKLHIILPEPPYSFGRFLTGLDWRPSRQKIFGIFPMIAGTLLASFGAILLGVPIALLCALFMAEFLPATPASLVRSGIELLAGIPSVVYGFFGLMVIVPAVKNIFSVPSGNTLLSAIIVLALMILPTVITIAETSLRAVPLSVREASLSLGASKMQTAWRVVLPHANSGVIAGIILGISRAVGETMAVILVAGNSPQLVHNPLQSVRTLTSTIAMEMGYASGRHSEMLFSIGVVLFSIILILNSMILWFRRRTEAES
ncbi:MAG: phosphate ABC transporter permease subunit PstC [Treponema sp.]|jgi:phosphate transport system permease protein|nr:phosphate ABC transporter permease subunit PstC [Treponema sp.]